MASSAIAIDSNLMMMDKEVSFQNMPAIGEDLNIKDHKQVQMYYLEYAKGIKKDTLTYILFQIYLLETKVTTDFDKFITEISGRKEISEEKYQKLLYLLYNTLSSINERTKMQKVYDLLSDKYQKMIDTDYMLNEDYQKVLEKDFKMKVESIEVIKKYIEE